MNQYSTDLPVSVTIQCKACTSLLLLNHWILSSNHIQGTDVYLHCFYACVVLCRQRCFNGPIPCPASLPNVYKQDSKTRNTRVASQRHVEENCDLAEHYQQWIFSSNIDMFLSGLNVLVTSCISTINSPLHCAVMYAMCTYHFTQPKSKETCQHFHERFKYFEYRFSCGVCWNDIIRSTFQADRS